jgi:hypothetical protein
VSLWGCESFFLPRPKFRAISGFWPLVGIMQMRISPHETANSKQECGTCFFFYGFFIMNLKFTDEPNRRWAAVGVWIFEKRRMS